MYTAALRRSRSESSRQRHVVGEMRTAAALLLTLVVLTKAQESPGFLASIRNRLSSAGAQIRSTFAETETAPFTPINSNKTYEERLYPARQWVCTSNVTDITGMGGRRGLFMRLYGYITGNNENGQSMAMTSPVTMMWEPVTDSTRKFTMCFYVNEEFQASPPAPSDPTVFLQSRPELTVIALREGGYPDEADWERMAQKLKQDAIAEGDSDFDFSKFYRAGYDSPMKFWNRRNEVWYTKA